ncbi:hypothetical protein WMY93_017494 [Mugilogobius chulae]|uniref:MHC class I antigen n=1 Tax=Mugilogobius chulae TaxID=88201 RepID=A0AAW0NYP2_9GOBI
MNASSGCVSSAVCHGSSSPHHRHTHISVSVSDICHLLLIGLALFSAAGGWTEDGTQAQLVCEHRRGPGRALRKVL